jgi:hypothetical protein
VLAKQAIHRLSEEAATEKLLTTQSLGDLEV